MKSLVSLCALSFAAASMLGAATQSGAPVRPLVFEPGAKANEFIARGPAGALHLTVDGIELAAKDQPLLRLVLKGSRRADPAGEDPLSSVSHYFLGKDPRKWRTGVANFAKVRYRQVYPGIDLLFYGAAEGSFEYDFLIAPNADPSAIRMRFDGAKDLSLNTAGDLIVGGLTQHRPRVSQGAKNIDGRFRLRRDRTVSFELAAYDHSQPLTIDPLITYISYLGGSSGDIASNVSVDDTGNVYVTGNTFSADFPGNIPLGSRPNDRQFAFVSKFGPFAGGKTQFLFTVFLGDNTSGGYTVGNAVTSDGAGNIIVAGDTDATGFPTMNAVQTQVAGGLDCALADDGSPILCQDGFLSKISPDGRSLIFSTYYGGKNDNRFSAVTTDAAGNIYAAGYGTGLTDLQGTPNAIQPTATGSQDMMLVRFDPTGKVLYSTYLGGSKDDQAATIALEKTGVVWIAGTTHSADMPIPAAKGVQPVFTGLLSAFVARIDTTQSGPAGLTYATYFNGTLNTAVAKIFLDPAGQVVFCGSTVSADLPTTPTAFETGFIGFPVADITNKDYSNGDGFLARFNPAVAGSAGLTYSTFVGGSGSDAVNGCGQDPKGNFVVSGYTGSADLFFQLSYGSTIPYKAIVPGGSGANFFLISFNPTIASVAGQLTGYIGSFLDGGDQQDLATAMATDTHGFAYLAGRTMSKQFPTSTNALQRKYGGDDTTLLNNFGVGDAFLVQVDLNQNASLPTQLIQAGGDFQFGAPGTTLAAPIAIQLATASGTPLPISGYPIMLAGSGFTATPAQPLTDGSGIASASIQLTGDAAITATVNLSGASIVKPYTFHLKALSGTPPKSVAIVSGDKQSANAGAALAQPLVVELRDGNNAAFPLAGLTVQFIGTNASVPAVDVVTDSTGRASTTVTLGSAAGSASVQVVVGSLAAVTASFTIAGGGAPVIAAGAVVNGATFLGGGVSPGLIVTLFGTGIGPAVLAVNAAGADGKFSTTLAGTQVFFDGVAAPMIYASSGQTSVIVPYAVAGKSSTQVTVADQNVASAAQAVAVVPAQLGLFASNSMGSGQGAILNQDNSINSSSNPAKRGSIVVLFGTGEGQTMPPGVDGQAALGPVYPKPNTPITVKIAGSNGNVLYYGAAPTLVAGVLQVNVTIPSGIPDGNATIQLFEGSNQSPATVTVAVKGDQ